MLLQPLCLVLGMLLNEVINCFLLLISSSNFNLIYSIKTLISPQILNILSLILMQEALLVHMHIQLLIRLVLLVELLTNAHVRRDLVLA